MNISEPLLSIQNTDPRVKNELKDTYMVYRGIKRDSGGIENPLKCIDIRFLTTLYGNSDTIVKLIHASSNTATAIQEFKESCEKEVKFQSDAATYDLGPKIYEHGLYTGQDSLPFDIHLSTFNSNGDDITYNILYTPPFYYIVMEYYSKENGWRGPIYQDDTSIPDCKNKFIDIICRLAIECNIVNVHDPIMHFYYNPDHGLRMIDYGRCIYLNNKNRFQMIKQMCKEVSLIKSMGNSSLDDIINQRIYDMGNTQSSGKVKKIRQTYRAKKPYGGKRVTRRRSTYKRSSYKRSTRKRSSCKRSSYRRSTLF